MIATTAAMLAVFVTAFAAANAKAETTVTVAPVTPTDAQSFPFGFGTIWPSMAWVYKNVPAFQLKPGDTIAFDLRVMNDADAQLDIAMAPTTVNGGDVPAAPFTALVSNTSTPTNPRGNTTVGDFELAFSSTGTFTFPGGGLLIRFSNPGTQLAADATNSAVMENLGTATDPSGFFVGRYVGDPDGVHPWTGTFYDYGVGAFRLTIADVPVPPPTTTTIPTKAKCKKKKRKKAAPAAKRKKCKKKKRK